MKDFMLILFYQAIVAVNTAIIVNGIIWLARRKDKQEKKPNPDFSPPPTKKPPAPPTTGTNVIKPKDTTFYTLEIRDGAGNPVVATFSAKSEEELKEKIEKLKEKPIAVYAPAEESVKRYEQRMTRICRNCKHFLTTDEEATEGECGLNDEIMFKDETRACFEPKSSTSKVRPVPLGTKTTH